MLTCLAWQFSTHDEAAALGQYSPRIGEQVLSSKPAAPEKSKIHFMAPTQYLNAISKCAKELEIEVCVPSLSQIFGHL